MTLDAIRARDAEAMSAAESGGVFAGGNLLLAPADRHELLRTLGQLEEAVRALPVLRCPCHQCGSVARLDRDAVLAVLT